MKSPAILIFLALLLTGCASRVDDRFEDERWRQYPSPEAAGFSEDALEPAFQAAAEAGSVAVMAVHRGRVLFAWGDIDRELELHSVRKSIYSVMAGIAAVEGLIDLDATVTELGIDDLQGLTAQEQQARFVDLIAARSGVYHPSAYSPKDMDKGLPARGSHPPGSHFYYNNWDFNVAASILEQAAGGDLYEAFQRWIADPLGMQDWTPADGYRAYEPLTSRWPAHTFRMSTRDLARFGLLIEQQGRWNGQQIVPENWVERSTKRVSEFESGCGYGYMWWVYPAGCLPADRYPAASQYDIVMARGTGGQALFIIPAADLVVVHRGDTDQGAGVSGGTIWGMLETVLAARTTASATRVDPVAVQPRPFPGREPYTPPRLSEVSAADAVDLMGRYEFAPGVHGQVFAFQDHAYIQVPGEGEAQLFRLEDGRLTVVVEPGVRITTQRDADGEVAGLLVRVRGNEIRAKKVE